MTFWLSQPVEQLVGATEPFKQVKIETLIVGSGYAAAMAALALSEHDSGSETTRGGAGSIVVLERGDEYLPQDFPRTVADLPNRFANTGKGDSGQSAEGRYRKRQTLKHNSLDRNDGVDRDSARAPGRIDSLAHGPVKNSDQPLSHATAERPNNQSGKLWDIRRGDGCVSITGNGLGGTSLVNASVAVAPSDDVLKQWPETPQGSWSELFERCYSKIYKLLGVCTTPQAESFAKFRALQSTAGAMDNLVSIEAAPVAINFTEPSVHSVDHAPCNYCGNCVIGCHSGAKQSLNLNAWPLARQRGVQLYTGATVTTVKLIDDHWEVGVSLTSDINIGFQIIADRVILAAGTIGSTEILARSQSDSFRLSDRLGRGFSTNGDGLLFGVGQRNRVGAVADVPYADKQSKRSQRSEEKNGGSRMVGPTIVGMAKIAGDANGGAGSLTIEDGAVPYPFTAVWREMVATQSFLRRYVSDKRSAWHTDNRHDGLAGSSALAEHSQVLLAMGFDGNHGHLSLDGEGGSLLPNWPVGQDHNGYFERLESAFDQAEQSGGFDGGEHQPNPLWKPLPDEFSGFFEGAADLKGSVTTVHPLGGCCMGVDVQHGVVNTGGQVFCNNNASRTSVYPGLYVLDGAIVPGAVGVNPMITISALAYTLASRIAGRAEPDCSPFEPLVGKHRQLPHVDVEPVIKNPLVTADFTERLVWNLGDKKRPDLISQLQPLFGDQLSADAHGVVLDIRFYFDGPGGLDLWLENPDTPLKAKALVSQTTKPLLHESEDTFEPLSTLLELQGTVSLGIGDSASGARLWWRTIKSLARFWRYRKVSMLTGIRDLWRINPAIKKSGSAIRSYWRIARLHGDWRYLDYQFAEVKTDTTGGESCEPLADGLQINGKKTLAYANEASTVWDALFRLPVTWKRGELEMDSLLDVDLIRIGKGPAPIQLRQVQNEPFGIISMFGFGAYLFRLMAKTHFWSFGAHSYRDMPSAESYDRRRMNWPPQIMHYREGNQTRQSQPRVDYFSKDKLCRLVHYRPAYSNQKERPAILLVHGLAHGSEIFWTALVEENYTQFFLKQGYDVWIVDHRTSANTQKDVNPDHSWDDIALLDMEWAVSKVFTLINADRVSGNFQRVNVFSHCIGAGAMVMAILAGKMQQKNASGQSMIGSFVPHAVTPWLFGSASNRARGNGWGLVKDLDLINTVETRLHRDASGIEILFDRMATSTINNDERRVWPIWNSLRDFRGPGFARAVYYRYSIFWGMLWNHKNVNGNIKRDFAGLIGPVPVAVLQQAYQSVKHKRLVAADGQNQYINEANIKNYWTFPTLFVHGGRNQVFDIESSRLSAWMLSNIREGKTDPQRSKEAAMSRYAQNGVWLETLNHYGHMDIIFGDKASAEVCVRLDRFYVASRSQVAAWDSQQQVSSRWSVFARAYRNEAIDVSDAPRTRIEPMKFPLTGPIISNATHEGLILWAESDDCEAKLPRGIGVCTVDETNGRVSKVDSEHLSGPLDEAHQQTSPGRFWLQQLKNLRSIGADLFVYVAHETDDPSQIILQAGNNATRSLASGSLDMVRMRDINPDAAYSINLRAMPWFQRLYGDSPARCYDLSFVAGSCLHPGLTFERDRADEIFNGMWQHVSEHRPAEQLDGIDLLLLLGDQIYADSTAGLFDPKSDHERFRQRYREAFGAQNMRRVMAHVPTHFVVDDHAYVDDYAGLPDEGGHERLSIAIAEARNFQSHSNGCLWQEFSQHGMPFFCFDTRFDRLPSVKTESTALVSVEQLNAFERWLISNVDSDFLFISTGAPIAPVLRLHIQFPVLSTACDGLVGYPGYLEAVTRLLIKYAAEKNIVWLSGDPHLSCYAEIGLTVGEGTIRVHNIIASPLHAPLPFANAYQKDYDWDVPQSMMLNLSNGSMQLDVTQHLLSTEIRQFTRLDVSVDKQQILVRTFGVDGIEIDADKAVTVSFESSFA